MSAVGEQAGFYLLFIYTSLWDDYSNIKPTHSFLAQVPRSAIFNFSTFFQHDSVVSSGSELLDFE